MTFIHQQVAKSFGQSAQTYDKHAFVQYEVGQRLLQRIQTTTLSPKRILDIGSGTGKLTRLLQSQFPSSDVFGLDLAWGMAHFAQSHKNWRLWKNQPIYGCGNMEQLPFQDNSMDLIFSNCTFQWANDLPNLLAECKRVLSPNGMLFFSTMGPNTLIELRKSFATLDDHIHVHDFMDMHDIGDSLLNAAFSDPVIDMETLTVYYKNVPLLLKDLKGIGAVNLSHHRSKGCMTPRRYAQLCEAYEIYRHPETGIPASFEIVYGHAVFIPKTFYRANSDGVITIPGNKIPTL